MEIIALPIQTDEVKIDSRFRLVMAAAHRVRQLNTGAKCLAESKHYKNTSSALEEILQGKTDILQGEEARKLIAVERAAMEEKRASSASAEDVFVLRRKAEKRDEIEAELKQFIDDRTSEEEGGEGEASDAESSDDSSEEGDEW